jgi:hypothetical protein
VVLLGGVVLTSYGAVYYYQEVSSLQSQNGYLKSRLGSVSETLDVAVDFGNGTRIWYNDTYVPVGSSVFNATYVATGGRMTTQNYGFGNVTGIFVTGILGVSSNSSSYWLWYYYDNSSRSWAEASVGADAYLAVQGGAYLWNYTTG